MSIPISFDDLFDAIERKRKRQKIISELPFTDLQYLWNLLDVLHKANLVSMKIWDDLD